MPLVCYVSERDINTPLDAERLLRLLGVSGKLSGFYFAVYMIEQVDRSLITFCSLLNGFISRPPDILELRVAV